MQQKLQLLSLFFMKSIFSLPISSLNVILKILYDTKQNEQIIYCERFSLKITNTSCNKELKNCKFRGKEIKENTHTL